MSPKRALCGAPSAPQATGSAIARASRSVGRWGDVALRDVGAFAEEMLFHLARQVLAGTRIGQVQPVLVDQHGLLLEPGGPGLLADAFPDALAEFTRVGREIEPLGLFAELDALDHACHLDASSETGGGVA